MKKIIYLLIAVFIFGIIANGFKNQLKPKTSVLIQSTDNKISPEKLSQSAKIISGRLQSFNLGKFELRTIPEKLQIEVIFTDKVDLKTIENLLTQQGDFGFYSTYNHDRLSELLKGDNHLFSLLNAKNSKNSSAEIGYTTVAGVEKVNEYIHTLELNNQCKFVWSQPSENSEVCLYALRLENGNGAILTGSDIESFKSNQEKTSGNYNILIEFKKEAIAIWADATKRNINNAIAIVMDNQVIFAPILKSVIEGGKCEISGKFTETEARSISALGNNGELPVSFRVVR